MRIWMKWVGMLALLLAVVAGFYLALREQPVAFDIARVAAGPMKVSIEEEGVTRVKEVYSVSSPIAGHLDRTTLDEGEPVTANVTVIASIHPLDPPFLDQRTRAELMAAAEAARSAVALAKVELQRAQTAHSLARSNYERAAKLEKTNTISISQLERAYSEMQLEKAQIDSTQATIKLREAELDSAKARLQQPSGAGDPQIDEDCCVSIVAPIDGVILRMLARSEQAVSPGTRIAEIGDPHQLEIVVDLLSSDAAKIRVGASVEISDWGGPEKLQGIVQRVEPAAFTKVSALGIEEQRVNVVVDLLSVPRALGPTGFTHFERSRNRVGLT